MTEWGGGKPGGSVAYVWVQSHGGLLGFSHGRHDIHMDCGVSVCALR